MSKSCTIIIQSLLLSMTALAVLLAPATLLAQSEQYVIGPGDTVAIEVFGEDDLSPTVKVSETGTIAYPFLGELQVAGLSTEALESTIIAGLKGPYLIDPRVAVSVSEYRPFYIHGEVQKPGGFEFEPGMTVRKAVSLAGGLTERASERKIFLRREGETDDEKGLRVELDHPVRPGDIITIEQSFF